MVVHTTLYWLSRACVTGRPAKCDNCTLSRRCWNQQSEQSILSPLQVMRTFPKRCLASRAPKKSFHQEPPSVTLWVASAMLWIPISAPWSPMVPLPTSLLHRTWSDGPWFLLQLLVTRRVATQLVAIASAGRHRWRKGCHGATRRRSAGGPAVQADVDCGRGKLIDGKSVAAVRCRWVITGYHPKEVNFGEHPNKDNE